MPPQPSTTPATRYAAGGCRPVAGGLRCRGPGEGRCVTLHRPAHDSCMLSLPHVARGYGPGVLPWIAGGRVTSTKTAGAGGMSSAVHLCALRTGPSSLRHSRNTL